MLKPIGYIFILIGGFVAIYAQANEQQNQFLLIGGIIFLMSGIYIISRNIPSKSDNDDDQLNDEE